MKTRPQRKICVFTGSRAEYGLLRPLMRKIQESKEFSLQLVVTGMHLSNEYGLTYREIEKDGFDIAEKIEILLSSDSAIAVSKAVGLGCISFSEAFARLSPDLIVLLGDRFETFAAATAAHIARIPIAHLHGGELTEGAFDDAFRHAITKMSSFHFTSTEPYRCRVIQLGEQPESVYNVGAIGLDNIHELKLLSKKDLEKELHVSFLRHNIMVTFHPATIERNSAQQQCQALLGALSELKDTLIVFTKSNADAEGRLINSMVEKFVDGNRPHSALFPSLGQLKYLSMLQFVDGVVGNSSSGIIEAPSFRIGTINIGSRQSGRIKAASVIDCPPEKDAISDAFQTLYSHQFRRELERCVNPYGAGGTSNRILSILKKLDFTSNQTKRFNDIVLNN